MLLSVFERSKKRAHPYAFFGCFLAAGFLAAGLAADFLAAGLAAVVFLAAGFLAEAFLLRATAIPAAAAATAATPAAAPARIFFVFSLAALLLVEAFLAGLDAAFTDSFSSRFVGIAKLLF
jgi:hypothetical protein